MIESFNKKELETQIDRYVNDLLTEEEIDELWIELIQDDYHLDYLKSVANLKAVVEKKRENKRKKKIQKTWTFTAAAVVVILVAVLAVFDGFQNSDSSMVQPVNSIELDYYRSGENAVTPNHRQILRNAIELANTGKFGEAVSLLKKELEQANDPEWISELSLNLGSLYYNEGSFQQSIDYFENVLGYSESVDVLTLEKAYWYMGNAHFQLDRMDSARANIEKAYELNGAYSRVAKSYLDAMASTAK